MTEFAGFSAAEDLSLALALADTADAISLPRFGAADLRVDAKPDMTPVSDADLAVERTLRAVLADRRPADAVVGEEFGGDAGADTEREAGSGAASAARAAHGRAWVIDPIDGTKNFVRGVPIWATLISLLIDGAPVIGVVSAPALARRWWGSAATGAHSSFGGGPPRDCHVSGVADLAHASLSFSDLEEWEHDGRGEQMTRLRRACWRTRGYGDFYSYMLVAEGAVDIAAEPELSLWDLAALTPIVIAAGGAFTTIDGSLIGAGATSALATNGRLHADARAALAAD